MWDRLDEPATLDPDSLIDAVSALAKAVRTIIGPGPQSKVQSENGAGSPIDAQELESRIAQARSHLEAQAPAESGKGGHDATIRIACDLARGFDLPMHAARSLISEWNQRCLPPWSDKELEHKLSDADNFQGPRGYLLRGSKNRGKGAVQKQSKTQATILVEIGQRCELFHDDHGVTWATMPVNEHVEHWGIKSHHFRTWLSQRYYLEHGRAATVQALKDALNSLIAEALFGGRCENVFLRTAWHGRDICVDMGDDQWTAIRITRKGWMVTRECPVRFRRAPGMLQLPAPIRGGDARALAGLINVDDQDLPLILSWLVMALRPEGPYPPLVLIGEEGSCKTTCANVLRSLVDPNAVTSRSMSRSEHDLAIAANSSWVLNFDNVSRVPPWMSDAICRLVTGGGFGTRTLYECEEETLFHATRPLILNGIEDFVTQGDLADRAIQVTLQALPPSLREDESTFRKRAERLLPEILGGILNGISMALRDFESVDLLKPPRTADFARFSVAAAPALGHTREEILGAYEDNRREGADLATDDDTLFRAVCAVALAGEHQWTARGLLDELNRNVTKSDRNPKTWPGTARGLSGKVRRLSPILRSNGVEVEFRRGRNEGKHGRFITLRILLTTGNTVNTVNTGSNSEPTVDEV